MTQDFGSRLFSDLFYKKGSLALRTGAIDRPIPDGKLAGRIIAAGIKRFPFAGALLNQIPPTVRRGTFDA
jgi:hypothetical protein